MSGHSPRQRLLAGEAHSLSPTELLAIILSPDDEPEETAMPSAQAALRNAGSLREFGQSFSAVLREHNLPYDESLRVLAAYELGKRAGQIKRGERQLTGRPEEVVAMFSHLEDERKEHFIAVLLDTKNQVITPVTIHIGTVSSSVVGVREFFRPAVQHGATSVIAVHNHPSGNPQPSPEDISVTRTLAEAGRILDIPLLDHIIIGTEERWVSLRRQGYIG